jgi:hypothetical protein
MSTITTIQFMPKLSKASKMPCESFSLPAQACKTGAKLAKIKGSVCNGCYALKGNYHYPNVKAPREHNLDLVTNGDLAKWSADMVNMINSSNTSGFFRWHDSGDVQSYSHLLAIIGIAHQLPAIRFWLPTKEKALLNQLKRDGVTVPDNLAIRLSMAMIDQPPSNSTWPLTSTVHKTAEAFGVECDAYTRGGKCLTCRKCWDASVPNVSYPKH